MDELPDGLRPDVLIDRKQIADEVTRYFYPLTYAQWRAWCGDQGRDRPGTVQAFGTALRSALPHLKVAQHRNPSDDKLARYYLGVRLRKEADS